MATYLKVQQDIKALDLSQKSKRVITKQLKKACKTRWLSFHSAVEAIFDELEAVMKTLTILESDATAVGLLKKISNPKFVGCLCILKHVLPSLAKLSKAFQQGSVNFSNIKPSIAYTKQKVNTITETGTPVKEFAEDFKTGGRRSSLEICVRETDIQQHETVLKKYTRSLMNNIDARFESSLPVLEAFSIFDCMAVPSPSNKVKFQEYGEENISTLAGHYFTRSETDEEEVLAAKMRAKWGKLKFDLHEWKAKVPKDVKDGKHPSKIATTTWTLQHLLQQPSYRFFYPMLIQLAECCLSLPVSDAWPERGASALKHIKTELRSREVDSQIRCCSLWCRCQLMDHQ